MGFHQILQEIMAERGLSIPDVARACGLPDGTIRSIITRESKSVTLEVAFKLSDGLNVSLERLNGLPLNPNDVEPAFGAPGTDTFLLSKEAMEVARAYDTASEKDKRTVRVALSLEQGSVLIPVAAQSGQYRLTDLPGETMDAIRREALKLRKKGKFINE